MRKKESPLETQLKEATSREKWGVPNTTLQAIATATNNMEDCDMVMSFIWKILQEKKDKEWRRIVKTMALLEVILKHGSERAIQDIRRDQWRIQQWKEFRFMEEGKDVGAGIRSKAAAILEMLTDEEYLQEEKEKAQKLSQKMTSVGAPGSIDNKQAGGSSAFKSPFDRARRPWRRKQPEESPHSSPSSPVAGRLPQSEADVAAMVQLFMNMTNESRLTAQDWLERHSWNVEEAVFKYMNQRGGPRPGDDRPGMMERKSRAEQFMTIAKVTEKEAEEYLERCAWNVEEALDKFLAEGAKSAPPASKPSSKPAAKPRAPSTSSSSGSESYSDESEEEPSKPSAPGGWPQAGGDAGGWPSSASGGGGWPSSNFQKGGDWPDNSGGWPQSNGQKGGGGGWPGGDKGGGKGPGGPGGPWGAPAPGSVWGGGGAEWGSSGKGALGPAAAGDGKGFGGPPGGKGDPGSGWGGSSMSGGYGGGKGFASVPGGAGAGNPFGGGGDTFPPQSQAPRPSGPGPFGSSSGSKGGFGGPPASGFGGPPSSGGFGSQAPGGFGGGKGPAAGNPFGGGQAPGGFGGPPTGGFDKGGGPKGGWDAQKGGGPPPGSGGFGSKGGGAGNPFGAAPGPGGPGGFQSQPPGGFGSQPAGGFGSQPPGGFGGAPKGGFGKGPAGPFGGGGGGGGYGGWPS